jgi:hypothetical protein
MQGLTNLNTKPVPEPSINKAPEPKQEEDPYGNFDLLDNIQPPMQTVQTPAPAPVQDPVPTEQTNDILDFQMDEPVNNTQPPPQNNNDLNFDLLSGTPNMQTSTSPNVVQNVEMENPIEVQNEPELLPDDTVWLNERELDNSGKDGIRVFGKWYLKMKSKIFLRVTVWNKGKDVYRSPRLDIKDNYYGILFLKDGVGVPLKTLNSGEFISFDKGN